jgi:DNA-binding NarL/FixJ family response regulator
LTRPATVPEVPRSNVRARRAEGHANREIGTRLCISQKTVSVHVSNTMAKLAALSRHETAATVERLGLL